MTKALTHIASTGTFKTPPLSVAVRAGNLVFVSGTPGYDKEGRISSDFGAQFDQAVATPDEVLQLAGSSMRSLVKVNVLLTRLNDIEEMNRRYGLAFGPAPYPARTTAVVLSLPDPRMLIEIECVALADGAAA